MSSIANEQYLQGRMFIRKIFVTSREKSYCSLWENVSSLQLILFFWLSFLSPFNIFQRAFSFQHIQKVGYSGLWLGAWPLNSLTRDFNNKRVTQQGFGRRILKVLTLLMHSSGYCVLAVGKTESLSMRFIFKTSFSTKTQSPDLNFG